MATAGLPCGSGAEVEGQEDGCARRCGSRKALEDRQWKDSDMFSLTVGQVTPRSEWMSGVFLEMSFVYYKSYYPMKMQQTLAFDTIATRVNTTYTAVYKLIKEDAGIRN